MQEGSFINYICPFAMEEQFDTRRLGANAGVIDLTFFTNATSSQIIVDMSLSNPYYYSAMLVTGRGMIGSSSLKTDPDVLRAIYDGGTAMAVFCNYTVYDVTYSSVNGTIRDWRASPSSITTMGLVGAGNNLQSYGMPYLVQAVSLAGFSKTGREIADQFALAYSRNTLGATALAFDPQDAIVSQEREQIQVTMVPKTSLYVLVAANLLLVVFGCILTALALMALSSNTGEVQARLSIHALIATAFESRAVNPVDKVEDFFEGKHSRQGTRLEFVRSIEEGWSVG